ncbi:MAG: hypothetical protein JNM07_03230 [Phycisphaerae bacterium]|nr:hypothetical protein [Phycisphaerae bacterium]
MRRNTPLIVVLLAAGAGLACWSWFGSAGRRAASTDQVTRDRLAAWDRVSNARVVTLSETALAPIDSLPSEPRGGAPALAPAQDASLRTTMRQFVMTRWAGTPDAYAAWRESRGDHPKHEADLIRDWFLLDTCRAYLGRELIPGESMRSLFLECARVADTRENGRHRLTRIPAEASGWGLAHRVLTRADPAWPDGSSEPARALRHNPSRASMVSWWESAPHWREVLDRHGALLAASFCLYAGFGDEAKHPVTITWYWDPVQDRWLNAALGVGVWEGATPRIEF